MKLEGCGGWICAGFSSVQYIEVMRANRSGTADSRNSELNFSHCAGCVLVATVLCCAFVPVALVKSSQTIMPSQSAVEVNDNEALLNLDFTDTVRRPT